ncbi:GNAT family N-acetyltransferase [Streptomyces piniterrae]|uniref:GNAT family N-acetyltransferase n=1 Tax=Streptomyces piniterrae TaxID=2571125 RepID=A0A4U0NVQ8_9ACTN|nr:GNAT family protein [Streptomyces piniterrae]TJZ58817.1 GNAT family N-acetyltransferase [Streptomyces piniterrae]
MITASAQLTPDVLMRPATPEDATGLARAYRRSRAHLHPWEPDRDDAFFTPAGQAERLRLHLAEQRAGRMMPWVLVRTTPETVPGIDTPDEACAVSGRGTQQRRPDSGTATGPDSAPEAKSAPEPHIVGAITLSDIALGPFRSAGVGYWIAADHVGHGLATAAVNQVCATADRALGLHRLEAGTLVDNVASQRVLAKCGFTPYGTAAHYLHINGAWRDHRLFQKILNDRRP